MRRPALLFAVLATVATTAAHAQCYTQTFFEFQVERQARFIPDSSSSIVPIESPTPNFNPPELVQFVVDTSGLVDSTSFKILKSSDMRVSHTARALLRLWRFTPAMIGNCKVRQLVQTAIGSRPRRAS